MKLFTKACAAAAVMEGPKKRERERVIKAVAGKQRGIKIKEFIGQILDKGGGGGDGEKCTPRGSKVPPLS